MTRRTITALCAALAFGVAACGGDDEGGGGGGGGGGEGATAGEPAEAPGFDGTTIKLGVLTPLSGPVAVIGQPLTAGNRVWWEAVNAEGGVGGKYKVELVQEDTRYEPDTTVQKYQRLKQEVAAFQQVLGTAPTLAVVPQLERDDILAAPASLDALWVREGNLLPVGGPYQLQAINGIDYYRQQEGEDKRICVMLQDDAYGEAGLAGVRFAAEQMGFEIASTQRYKAGDQNVTGQVQQLQQARCDAVWLTAIPSDAGTIWGTAAKLNFAPQWMAQSAAWIDELGSSPLAEYLQKTTWVVAEGTEWGDTEVPGMAEMVQRVEQFAPDQEPDYYFAFGYNQGRAMQAVLEKAVENGDLSQAGIVKAVTQVGEVSFDGLTDPYTYGPPEQRNPPRTSTIFEVVPDKPFGLGTLEFNYSSEAAKQYQFEEADL